MEYRDKKEGNGTGMGPDVDANSGVDAGQSVDAKSGDDAKPRADAKPGDDAKPRADAKPGDDAKPRVNAKPGVDAGHSAGVGLGVGTDSDAGTEQDIDAESGDDAELNVDSKPSVDTDSFRVRSELARRERNVKRNHRVIFLNATLALLVIMFVLITKIVSLQGSDAKADEPSRAAMEQKGGKALANTDKKGLNSAKPKATETPKPTKGAEGKEGAEKWMRNDLDPDKPMVALTFDDGPYTPVTKRILKVMEKNDGRATFFVVANRIVSFPKVFKQAYDEGNQIASHTYGHVNLSKLNKKQINTELAKANKEVKRIIGCKVTALRPPGGNISETMRRVVDVPMIYWSVDTEDWKSRNKSKILKRCADIEDGDIVLMHDLYSTTADAVEVLVPRLKKKGYQLVTIDELFYYKGIKMKAGIVYASGK